ncbi:GNAT family N-acetyltransferase [Oceanirhabdus seepicola]|uniref:GNAT family N-acetyltransferase n=1 Tax=Oceanirhabdus seepicola TaxID=2828781 RepID=A0A9J6P151_9CLOT|nr:GNAT family N-acetyltransferase [Oceanirhabdus seepicola]MCM1989176.1 GNAT family N-acetyltransferase [Oceanirhabdus seepicola]
MICLETEHLILRNYRIEDFNDIYDYFSNEEVARYEDFYPMSEDEVKELIKEWQDKDSRLVVELKDKHVVIGSIGYFVDEDDDYSMDFDFNPDYGKKGYATEAGKKLLEHLFNTVDVKEVYGDCDINNENSWKLLERLGFKRIRQIDDESYKEDMEGNEIIISIYLYKIEKNNYSLKL